MKGIHSTTHKRDEDVKAGAKSAVGMSKVRTRVVQSEGSQHKLNTEQMHEGHTQYHPQER